MKQKYNYRKCYFVLVLLFLIQISSYAKDPVTFSTNGDGKWIDPIWDKTPIDSKGNIFNISLNDDVSITSFLSLKNTPTLNVSGILYVNALFFFDGIINVKSTGKIIMLDSGVFSFGTKTVLNIDTGGELVFGTASSNPQITVNIGGELTINGDLNLKQGSALNVMDGGSLTVNGNITKQGGTVKINAPDGCDNTSFTVNGTIASDITVAPCLYDQIASVNWTGASTTNDFWNTTSNWNINREPSAINDVIIPSGLAAAGYPVVNGASYCNNLTIEDGASVTATSNTLSVSASLSVEAGGLLDIQTAGTVTVIDDITIFASTDNNGVLIEDGTLTIGGTANYQRTMSSVWHYVSSPVIDASTNTLPGIIYDYDESKADNWADLSNPIAYNGWRSTTIDDLNFLELMPDADMLPTKGYAFESGGTINFSGSAYNSNTTANQVAFTTYNSLIADGAYDGWNFIGNPFPCPIEWGSVDRANVDAAAYLFDGVAYTTLVDPDDFVSVYVGGVSGIASRSIAPCQGFFVHNSVVGNGTVTFPNTSKQTSPTATFHKKKRGNDYDNYVYNLIRLEIKANSQKDEMVIRLFEKATDNFDGEYDAYKRFPNRDNRKPEIFAQTPDGEILSISTMPETTTTSTSKIGYWIGQNSDCTIKLIEQIPGAVVLLNDKLLDIITDLTQQSYTFAAISGKVTDRFEISFTPPAIWRGKFSNNWNDSENWDKDVPTALQNVVISYDGIPEINENIECNRINIMAGAVLKINKDANLKVNDKVVIEANAEKTASLVNNGNIDVIGDYVIEKFINSQNQLLLSKPVTSVDGLMENENIEKFDSETNNWASSNIADANGLWRFQANENHKISFSGQLSNNNNTDKTSKFRIISNPYLTPINLNKLISDNLDVIGSTVYSYAKNENNKNVFRDYTYHNKAGNIGFDSLNKYSDYLGIAEGILVENLSDADVIISDYMQVPASEVNQNPYINSLSSLKFSLKNNKNEYNETLIAFTNEAGDGYDTGYDAEKLSNDGIALYSIIDNTQLAIQALHESKIKSTEVSLGFRAETAGEYKLNLDKIAEIQSSGIYLVDMTNNKIVNLNLKKEYIFTTDVGEFNDRFKIKLTQKTTFTGATSNLWNDSENWDNGVPDIQTSAFVPEDKEIVVNVDNAKCFNLVLAANSLLNVKEASNLEVSQSMTMLANEKGSAYIIEQGDINCTGNVIYEIQPKVESEALVSSPLSDAKINNFNKIWFFNHLATDNSFNFIQATDILTSSIGYKSIFIYNEKKIEFEGQLNNGNYETDLLYSIGESNGLNLIGNPYPSPINCQEFLNINSSAPIYGTVIGWQDTYSNDMMFEDYTYWTEIGSVGAGDLYQPNETIDVGEGFYVLTTGNGKVNFTNQMRITGTENQTKSGSNLPKLKLSIKSNDELDYNETLLAFKDDATEGFDNSYDAIKLDNEYGNISFYSLMDDKKLAIQTLPQISGDTVIVNLGLNTYTVGTYTIGVSEMLNFDEHTSLLLEDIQMGELINLSETTIYSFNSEIGNFEDRFAVHFQNDFITNVYENDKIVVNIYSYLNNININTTEAVDGYIEIYNYSGKLMQKQEVHNTNSLTIRTDVATGIYFVKLVSGDSVFVNKVFLE